MSAFNPSLPFSRSGDSESDLPIAPRVLYAILEHASNRPDSLALQSFSASGQLPGPLTYRQLHDTISRLAVEIRQHVQPDGVVLLKCENSSQFVAWFLAILTAGCRVLPIHPRLAKPEVQSLAKQTGASVMIGSPEHFIDRELMLLAVGLASAAESGESDSATLPQLSENGGLILQSSGTTGIAKLVFRAPKALDAVASAVAHSMRLKVGERVIAAIPLSHSYGIDILLATMLAGATLNIWDEFDPPSIARECSSGSAVVFPGVPFMFEAMSRQGPPVGPGESSLRLAVSAGAPLPARVEQGMATAWGIRVGQIYGATELGSVTLNDPDSPLFAPASVGLALPGARIRVLDPRDLCSVLPCGNEGHIAVRTPAMLSGYVPDGMPELVDGYLPTGDLGQLDEQNRLFITGRAKLLIDSGGLKINPIEVESALTQHPGVLECVVGPLPLSDTIVRLQVQFVAADPLHPPTESELRQHMKDRVAPYKIPRLFERVDALARSASGKVLRTSAFPGSPPPC